MHKLLFSHDGIVSALYHNGLHGVLDNERLIAAPNTGELVGLVPVRNNKCHQNDDTSVYQATDKTWSHYLGVLATLTWITSQSQLNQVDVDLAWGVDYACQRVYGYERDEAVSEITDLVLATMAQFNPMLGNELPALAWCPIIAVNSGAYLTEVTFGDDVRLDEYLALVAAHKRSGSVDFVPATRMYMVRNLVRGFSERAAVPRFNRQDQQQPIMRFG